MIAKLSSLALIALLVMPGCKKQASEKASSAPVETPAAADKAPAMTDQASPPPTPARPPTTAVAAEPPPPAAPTINSIEDYNAVSLSVLKPVIELFKAAGTDCDKLGETMLRYAASQESAVKVIRAYESGHPAAKKAFAKVAEPVVKQFEAVAGPAMEKCQDQKQLSEALAKLE